ncbi:MAG TPA: bifunctional 4-hydroxy-2-oxoglutarate aldolase/2-dehydro-3-deoxy-phosphogluconate aldolase [Spongiibacteraceae bacterium]|nr:bifunctional 4-hydroxy-2-oxoglutarate aldolase/2-dehydro-3-deoxy-phosphogluconate aldolase [Spongiibacteraceae bacterium]
MRTDDSVFMEALRAAPIIPVLTVADVEDAAPLAQALARAGVRVAEVTLRTPAALDVIRRMRDSAEHLLIGAGTVLDASAARASMAANATFLVTPGTTPALTAALAELDVLAIPGVASVSEAMARREEGFALLKLFPAEIAGGPPLLRALAGPLPDLKFIPTGGISLASVVAYLALPNVAGVGGTWIVTPTDIAARNWSAIEDAARAALAQVAVSPRATRAPE